MAGQGEKSLINAVLSFNYFFQLCLCFLCHFQELPAGARPAQHPLLLAPGRRRSGDKAAQVGELRMSQEDQSSQRMKRLIAKVGDGAFMQPSVKLGAFSAVPNGPGCADGLRALLCLPATALPWCGGGSVCSGVGRGCGRKGSAPMPSTAMARSSVGAQGCPGEFEQ